MKEKENPYHHMGNQTGYDLINGEYHIAPLYVQQFDNLACEATGIRVMLEMVTTHAAHDLKTLSEVRMRLWKELEDDLGIDTTTGTWSYQRGVVRQEIAQQPTVVKQQPPEETSK